ncbi:MAG TPA: 4-hydroxy-3-methylbut-2-enyl diphosphate reductase, partial [Streptosporangiaceae bacterium]
MTSQEASTAPQPQGRPLVICAPLRIEARALRRGLTETGQADPVLRTGYGPARARRRAAELGVEPFGMLGIAGTGAGLAPDLKPGDLVVGTEIVADGQAARVPCASAPLLAGELRRAGLRVRTGPVVTVDHLVRGADRERLAGQGAIAADMESAALAAAAGGRPVAVIRAVSDLPGRTLLHPSTVTGGLAALRSLRGVGPVLTRWAAAAGERQVLLAGPRSFCAGVERAIEIVERALELRGAPVYVRKQIVHNAHVVRSLEQRGAIFVDELAEVPRGQTVIFSAHGVSPAVRNEAGERELDVIDATCPLVSKVHAEARSFAAADFDIVLVGHEGHEEVEGTFGEAPERTHVIA